MQKFEEDNGSPETAADYERQSNNSTPLTAGDRNHAIAVAAATAAAAEAAVAAAEAAAKVVRLAGYGRPYSKEERAATVIQSYYRGHLVNMYLTFFFLFFLYFKKLGSSSFITNQL